MERDVAKPVDPRSANFVSIQPEVMQAAVDSWPRSPLTPDRVAAMLERAGRQFLLGDVDYDNFGSAMTTCFTAVEVFLKHLVGLDPPASGGGFAALFKKAAPLLTERELQWLEVARQLRNRTAHEGDFTVTPGMSDDALTATHHWIFEVSERCLSGKGA